MSTEKKKKKKKKLTQVNLTKLAIYTYGGRNTPASMFPYILSHTASNLVLNNQVKLDII